MSGQAEAFPGHPESWSLRPDSVNNSSVCGISENENWMKQKDDSHGADDDGNFSSFISPKTNNAQSESKPEGTCLQVQNRKETQSSIVDVAGTDANTKRKRHASASHPGNHKQMGRKRRKTTDRNTTHPKFLMGGSIKDPLNLNSLCNEEVSRLLNAATPISSPLPLVNKDPNPVIVPIDVRDPLKLNTVCSETDDDANLTRTLIPKLMGKKRKRWLDKLNESHSADEATNNITKPANLNLNNINKPPHHASASKIPDKIVSPVLPESNQGYRKRKKQEPTTKIARALLVDKTDSKPAEESQDKKVHTHSKDRITPEKRKYKRQNSKEAKLQPPKFKDQNKKFQYGNYHRYYGYRNPDQEDDSRIPFLKRKWFEGKTCLDIGCNSGHVTLYVAKNFVPERITGIDIDGALIGIARKNIRYCLLEESSAQQQKFPTSMEKIYGPIRSSGQSAKPPVNSSRFPGNVLFRCANFVPENEDILELQKPEYDTVLCLSVSKWIHLNWGDVGLKRMFRRIFLSLRPGGRLILEPQAWPSYTKKKKLTETIYKNFKQIQLKPDNFKDYLLSSHIGFSSCETIGTPMNKSKGFRRPILMFTKLTTSRSSTSTSKTVATSEQTSSSSSKQEQPTKPAPCKAPPTGDPTTSSLHHVTPSKPSAVVCPGKECDARSSAECMTADQRPVPPLVDSKHEVHSNQGKGTKLTQSEDGTKEESLNKTEAEDNEFKVDSKDDSHAQETKDTDLVSPPSKKIKTQPTN